MRFGLTEAEIAWRDEVRHFIREWADPEWMNKWTTNYERSGSPEGIAWRKALGARGWLCAGWPVEYGGLGKSYMEQWILLDEVSRMGLPKLGIGVNMIAHTLMRVANEAMKAEWLPRIAKGNVEFALGYSEPDAGTDLARLRTTAVLEGDEWVISGSKIWNSGGHVASHEWLAVRTDPSAPKHAGISIIIVPIDHLGVTVRPIWTLGGLRTNELFLDDVRVPRSNVVGEINRGWEYLTSALESERLVQGETGDLQVIFERLVSYFRRTSRLGASLVNDSRVRDWLARTETSIHAARLLSQHIARLMDDKEPVVIDAPMVKLFNSELRVKFADEACQFLGSYGLLSAGEHAPVDGFLEHHFRDAIHLTFAGGASEIQRDIVARRGLGLPRPGHERASREVSIPGLARLGLDELQIDLVDVVRRFRARYRTIETARLMMSSECDHDANLWRLMVESGWIGMGVSERFGGGGARFADVAVVAEELGRGLVSPTFQTTTSAAYALEVCSEHDAATDLLTRICSGDLLATFAVIEPDESNEFTHGRTVAKLVREGWQVRGRKMFVRAASSADIILLPVRMEDPFSERGRDVGLFAVDRAHPGVTVLSLPVSGSQQFAEVTFDAVVSDDSLLARGSLAQRATRTHRNAELALQLVDVIGLGQEVLEMTIAYMKTRNAFGTVLGTFQSVQHRCADSLVDLEVSRQLVYDAVARLSEHLPTDVSLGRAQSYAPEAMKRVALTAHQLHGGIGYSLEHDLHLYSNRIRSAELTLGTAGDHRGELADRILAGIVSD